MSLFSSVYFSIHLFGRNLPVIQTIPVSSTSAGKFLAQFLFLVRSRPLLAFNGAHPLQLVEMACISLVSDP